MILGQIERSSSPFLRVIRDQKYNESHIIRKHTRTYICVCDIYILDIYIYYIYVCVNFPRISFLVFLLEPAMYFSQSFNRKQNKNTGTIHIRQTSNTNVGIYQVNPGRNSHMFQNLWFYEEKSWQQRKNMRFFV